MIAKGVAITEGREPPPEPEEIGETGLSQAAPLGQIIAYAHEKEIEVDPLTMTKAEILEAIEEREIDIAVGDFIVGEQVRVPLVEDRESFMESLESLARKDVKMMAELLDYGYKGNWKPDQMMKMMAGEGEDWREVGALAEIFGDDEAYVSFGRTPEMGRSERTGKYFTISDAAIHERTANERIEKAKGNIDKGSPRIMYDPTGTPRYVKDVTGLQDGTNFRLVWELGDVASPADLIKPATIRYTEPGFGPLIKQINPDGMQFTQEELDQMKDAAEAGEAIEIPEKPATTTPRAISERPIPITEQTVSETIVEAKTGLAPEEARRAGREVFFAMMKHSPNELKQVWNKIPSIDRSRFKRMADGKEQIDEGFFLGIARELGEATAKPEVATKAKDLLYETKTVTRTIKTGGEPKKREFRALAKEPKIVRKAGEETREVVAEEAIAVLKKEAEQGKAERKKTTKRGKSKKKKPLFPARPPPKTARPPRTPPAPKSGEKKKALLDF